MFADTEPCMALLNSEYDSVTPYFRSGKRYYNTKLREPVQYKSTLVLDRKLDGNGWFHMETCGDKKDLFLLENRDVWDEKTKRAEVFEVYQIGRFVD